MIAILDDSLALETNGRGWTDHTESCDYWENCDGGTINQGLFLVNYRNKQRPLWGDTIDGVITIWMGRTNCSSRRSLFEEAQEVDAGGQNALCEIRHDALDSYRKIPSRNILISHSMGGVVSREYVQGNFYNDDVDKIITLDSPHEGTGALNMQFGLLLFCSKIRRESFKENRA